MASRLSGQNCKFFKFLLSFNSQKELRYKENSTKYNSLPSEQCYNIDISNLAYWCIAQNAYCSRDIYLQFVGLSYHLALFK